MRFTVKSPASSANLGPGFDAIGLALDLWNSITIDTEGEPGAVINGGTEAASLIGENNLTVKAMERLAREHGKELPSFALEVGTDIPIARGLGSSAAALVSGLVAANHLLDLGLSDVEIFTYAWRMEGHGDNVGAAFFGGAILAVPGIREATTLWGDDCGDLGLTAALFIPDATGATWAARAALPHDVPHADAAHNLATASSLAVGLLMRDKRLIAAGMNDRLHEPYRARLFPHLDAMKAIAIENGATGAALSGAGPTVLALVVPDRAQAVADAFEETAAKIGVTGRATVLTPVANGTQICD